MKQYFKKQLKALEIVYKSFDKDKASELLQACLRAIRDGNAIIVGGLGKNVPICEKFIGTLHSLGIHSHFIHINSAVHGDLGIIRTGDVVILLSKSGETGESIYLHEFLKERTANTWLLTCNKATTLEKLLTHTIILDIKHEGDPWNMIPNNSSVVFLAYLQSLAMGIIEELPVSIETFHHNHPGGHIGKTLNKKFKK